MEKVIVKSLHVYPIKSLGGQDMDRAQVTSAGFKYDRNWMLIDHSGSALTQRQVPEMALLEAKFSDGHLIVERKGANNELISLPLEPVYHDPIQVSIWSDKVKANPIDHEINDWFSDQLKTKVKLVKLQKEDGRTKYIHKEDKAYPIQFADGYPYLILAQASVNALNEKLPIEYLTNRFRANIVLENCPAHYEDLLNTFQIGEVDFKMVKKCQRCSLINTNQETAERTKEPLATLASYRTFRNGVYFGMNAIALGEGFIHIGDKIKKVTNSS